MKAMIVAAVAALSLASQAHASFILPSPINQIEFARNNQDFVNYLGTNLAYSDGNFYGGYITNSPFSVSSAMVELSPATLNQFLYSSSYLAYSFIITAPSVQAANTFQSLQPVVTASGSVTMQASGGGDEQIQFDEEVPLGPDTIGGSILDFFECRGNFQVDCGTLSFSTPVKYYRLNDTQFGGTMYMDTFSASFGIGSASGLLKHSLSLDSNFVAQHPGFTFENLLIAPPTVPEPATWAMLILGMAGIGAGLRRRTCVLAA